MAQFYLRKIKDGTITLGGVPPLWREKVEELLKEGGSEDERN